MFTKEELENLLDCKNRVNFWELNIFVRGVAWAFYLSVILKGS